MKSQKSYQGFSLPWALLQAALWTFCLGVPIHPVWGGASESNPAEETYKTYCLNCHGLQGKGDGPASKMLTPPPADFTSKKTKGKSDDLLLATIANGKPKTAMPPWKGTLSEQQMREVVGYIRTLGN